MNRELSQLEFSRTMIGAERVLSAPVGPSHQPLKGRLGMSDQSINAPVVYKEIPGFPGYRAGDDGSIWTCWAKRGIGGTTGGTIAYQSAKWIRLQPEKTKSGRLRIAVRLDNGTRRKKFVHRLVLEAFVGPCPSGMECCHFPDPDPENNRPSNLRWDAHQANLKDSLTQGTVACGERNGLAKLVADEVKKIRFLLSVGWTQALVAAAFKTSQAHVSDIALRKIWTHVLDCDEQSPSWFAEFNARKEEFEQVAAERRQAFSKRRKSRAKQALVWELARKDA